MMDNSIDMRDAFFNRLYDLVARDKNIIILTADHGAHGLTRIEQDFPNQYLNVGIAEQSLIGVAAGLAKCGKKVYAYAINNFASLRVLEQINIDVCAMNLDVNIIGVGAGFTYSSDGPTHHGIQDLAAVINLPKLQVYNVTDDVNTQQLVDLSYRKKGPKYFRIEKGTLPQIYCATDDIEQGFKELGPSGSLIGLISTGLMTHVARDVLGSIASPISHLDVYRLKPLPTSKIVDFSNNRRIIILEENLKSGGLGEKVLALLKESNHREPALHLAIKDDFYFSFGGRAMLHKQTGLDELTVAKTIRDFIK